MVTTIILSKDRPAQLDLLLRSIEKNGGGQFGIPKVIYKPSLGMDKQDDKLAFYWPEKHEDFEGWVRYALEGAGEFVCFMCDDGILYRPIDQVMKPIPLFPGILCFSLRMGSNTVKCYPSGNDQELPLMGVWDWTLQPRAPGKSDFGYPGSIDGHVFRADDARRMLDGKRIPNPTALECALVEGCNELAEERSLMTCYPYSAYVGNPINRVSEQSNVRYGERYPVTADECNQRFLAGERIDLEALDFSHVNGAHTEIELKWTTC